MAAAFMFVACNTAEYDLKNIIPKEYQKVVCFKNVQEAEWQLFDVGSELSTEFTILRSGGLPELDAETSVVSMTQEELSLYDDDYVLLDPSYYTLPTFVKFAPDERYKSFSVTIPYDKILELKANEDSLPDGKSYCLALRLNKEGETSVDSESGFVLRKVYVSEPEMEISISSGNQILSGEKAKITLKLPFENKEFDVKWNVVFESDSYTALNGQESTVLGNSLPAKYNLRPLPLSAIQNANVAGMGAGVNEVSYTIDMPEGSEFGNYYLNVSFSDFSINGNPLLVKDSEDGRIEARIRYEYCPDVDMSTMGEPYTAISGRADVIPVDGIIFTPESCDEDSYKKLLDSNVNTFWENRWGNSGYGVGSHIPFLASLDFGSVQELSLMEVWRRSGGYVTDLRKFEVYAAESLDYSDREHIKYTGLVYLGDVDFGGTSNKSRVQLFSLDAAKTRYLLLKFVGSNRGTCISVAELGCWRSKDVQQET